MKLWLTVVLLACSALAQGVSPQKEVVSFTFTNSKATPSEYVILLRDDCSATYSEKGGDEGEELVEQAGDDDDDAPAKPAKNFLEPREERESAPRRFPMTETTCRQVFDLARAADHFAKDVEFRKHKVAYTGNRILGYFAPGVSHKAAFTWSDDPNIQRLAAIFEGTAATLEAAPRLEKAYKFDKLGLNDLLKGLESQAQNGYLKEMWLMAPILKQIVIDPKVMNIARQRAQHLLALSQAGAVRPGK